MLNKLSKKELEELARDFDGILQRLAEKSRVKKDVLAKRKEKKVNEVFLNSNE
jgi:hypothetical protein